MQEKNHRTTAFRLRSMPGCWFVYFSCCELCSLVPFVLKLIVQYILRAGDFLTQKAQRSQRYLCTFALKTELAEEWHVDFDDNHNAINGISTPFPSIHSLNHWLCGDFFVILRSMYSFNYYYHNDIS